MSSLFRLHDRTERNKIGIGFRELKHRTKRFYKNINPKPVKNMGEITTLIALIHNIFSKTRTEGGVLPS
ncbi:MAG: hypothetical protein QW470_07700 [Candidatus Caldarchaeum sp.]